MNLTTDAVERATAAIAEQMEYELRGAWRAEYDYVHVYGEIPTVDPDAPFTIRQYVLPSDAEQPPRPPELQYRYTYDLTSVSDTAIRSLLREH